MVPLDTEVAQIVTATRRLLLVWEAHQTATATPALLEAWAALRTATTTQADQVAWEDPRQAGQVAMMMTRQARATLSQSLDPQHETKATETVLPAWAVAALTERGR